MNWFRTGIVVVCLLLVLFVSIPVHAAEVDAVVLERLQGQQEVSVIVMLNDSSLRERSSMIQRIQPHAPATQSRQEMVKAVQEEVLSSLKLKPSLKSLGTAAAVSSQATENYEFDLQRQYSIVNGFSGMLRKEGLEKLRHNPHVQRIYYNKILRTSLDVSVPLINANDVWNLSVGGYNITGEGETVCVPDTGIDTDHPAFTDKILAQYCYCSLSSGCCAGSATEASTAEDDQGHGTHIAGIAMGNHSTYTGVAKGAKVVAIKVCNNASSASCASADVISAIDWCTTNATKYNISVISLSLGDGTAQNTYCNSDSLASSINTAVGKNITVVVSSGNDGHTTGISSPSCIQNATPIGAVDDSDAILYNRGAILDLLAPGNGIVAPYRGGGTTSLSGTSMSAPHAAGAVALFRQYWRLAYVQTPSVEQVEYKLMISGKRLSDSSSGRNYSRIDILQALRPYLNFTLTSPRNESVINVNNSLINITSDVNLSTALLEWHYHNGTVRNMTMAKYNATSFNFNVTHLEEGNNYYRVYGNDSANTFDISEMRNITTDFTIPAVTVSNPAKGSNFSSGTQAFNATVNELHSASVLFSFTNATGTPFNITASNNSGNWNANVNLLALAEGSNVMLVLANDTAGNYNRTAQVQFTVDRTAPAVAVNSPLAQRNFTIASSNQTFNVTVTDTNLTVEAVLFSFDNSTGAGFNLTAVNQSGYWVSSYNVSILAEGAHIVTIIANDTIGNHNRTQTIAFTVDNTPPAVTINSPSANAKYTFSSSNQTFNATVTDTNLTISQVLFSFDNSTGTGFNLTAENKSGYWIAQYNVSLLADGTNTVTVFANDTVGNMNSTQNVTFSMDVKNPIVTLNSPATFTNTSSSSVTFNCSATDNLALANLTLYGNWSGSWHVNQTKAVNGTSNETTFSKSLFSGNYLWSCYAMDTDANRAFASSNFTVIVDTITPNISGVSSGTPTSSAATITWNTNEKANSTVEYGTAQSLGSSKSSTSRGTSHSVSLSSLSASTTYYYNVTSCDFAGNCNTTGTHSLATAAASSSSDSSSSSSSSSGGGGGGGSTTAAATAEETSTDNAEATDAPSAEATTAEALETASVATSKTVSLSKDGPSVVELAQEGAVTKIEFQSAVDKDIQFDFSYVESLPEGIAAAKNVYQYFEVKTDLAEGELKKATIQFTVPKSWLEENEMGKRSVRLKRYTQESWQSLSTKLVEEGDKEYHYQAATLEFSYFAIAAGEKSGNFIGGAVTFLGDLPSKVRDAMGGRGLVLLGTMLMITLLLLVYWKLHKGEEASR